MTRATFENTYPRYPFAPLVALALMLANRIMAVGRRRQSLKSMTASRHSAANRV